MFCNYHIFHCFKVVSASCECIYIYQTLFLQVGLFTEIGPLSCFISRHVSYFKVITRCKILQLVLFPCPKLFVAHFKYWYSSGNEPNFAKDSLHFLVQAFCCLLNIDFCSANIFVKSICICFSYYFWSSTHWAFFSHSNLFYHCFSARAHIILI